MEYILLNDIITLGPIFFITLRILIYLKYLSQKIKQKNSLFFLLICLFIYLNDLNNINI